MRITKQLAAVGALTTLSLAGVAGAGVVSAHNGANGESRRTEMAEKIATKFNLKQEDVQAVFDEEHKEHEAERQKEMSDRLQKKVDEGKITAEQKTLIENKMKELHESGEHDREAMKKWAEENNIDLSVLGGPGGRGHGKRGHQE